MILTSVFEHFRDVCLQADKRDIDPMTSQRDVVEKGNYKLDPAHYVSAPHLSWDAMMKLTGCKLDLISDPAMFEMIDAGMRGGVCMISQRYSKANNKYMGQLYDPTRPSVFIPYLDANNLYGWAMSQPLPSHSFAWLTEAEWKGIDWKQQTTEQMTGFFIECDLEYPPILHKEHNDYPLGPERIAIDMNMVSDKQLQILRHYDRTRTKQNVKLVPNLNNKPKYCLHYLLLKFYLEHGLILSKIHRVISFKQSRWLAPYIDLNSQRRSIAKNEFDKDFFKLMNNCIYGKTIENQKKRSDIRLVTSRREAEPLVNKPHCLDFRAFDESTAAIELRKVICRIDKPFYVGFTVLELSKLHMYRFHYNVIKPKYGEKARLLFTDTDSLMYEIETGDYYQDMWDMREYFDLSEFPTQSPFLDLTNKKVHIFV